MKLAKVLQSALLAGSACAAAVPHDTSPPVLRMSFNKRYGETYEDSSTSRLRKREDGTVDLDLKNRSNFYSVTLNVGSPSQEVIVLLDTGSSDLWITGSGNPYCEASTRNAQLGNNKRDSIGEEIMSWFTVMYSTYGTQIPTGTATVSGGGSTGTATASSGGSSATINCATYGTFNKTGSRTFKSNGSSFDISYGDGSFASGVWGTDDITVGGYNISNVSIAVANETNSTVGVLGIGLAGLESTYSSAESSVSGNRYTYSNFPMVLKDRGLIKKNVYSLYLNSSEATSGSILFGAVDSSKYDGQLYTLPILNQYKDLSAPVQFDITLQGMGMQNSSSQTTFTTTQMPALLDSGTTLAYLPEEVLEMIASAVGASYSSSYGYYLLSCPSSDDDTSLVFDFGGFHITANLSDLIIESSGSSCVLGLLPSGDNSAILGDIFLVNTYVVYDLESYEISMAQANYNSTSEDIELVTSAVPNAKDAAGYSSTYSSSQSITSGGNIFTSSSTLSGSASNPISTSTGSSRGSSKNMAAPSLGADSSPLLATIFCALSFFL